MAHLKGISRVLVSHKKALLLVDLQNDFCPGGSLAVPEGDAVIAVANRLQRSFDLIVASKDWHPPGHMSFASSHPGRQPGERILIRSTYQDLWPEHCLQDSWGAEFHPQLQTEQIKKVVYKGSDPVIDSYSAFFDNQQQRSTGLEAYLREQGVEEIYLMGLATDYCVKFTCLDALKLGFRVVVIEEGCRGVNLRPDDSLKALEEMRVAGAELG